MHLHEEQLRLSASDLARHLGCRHLTLLDRDAARGALRRPRWKDQALEILQQRGLIHEKAYLEMLRGQGLRIVEIHVPEGDPASGAEKTRQAMRDGADVIVQAVLEDGAWYGRADILRKVSRTGTDRIGGVGGDAAGDDPAAHGGPAATPPDGQLDLFASGPDAGREPTGDGPDAKHATGGAVGDAGAPSPGMGSAGREAGAAGADKKHATGGAAGDVRSGDAGAGPAAGSLLGDWSYEVYDTKLATETRAGTILQLCLYSDLVQRIQGVWPERMYVVSPGPDFPTHEYRLDDFLAYYRLVRGRLLEAVDAKQGIESIYPEPVSQCDICVWWQRCDERRRADDHLSLVAGMQSLHSRELQRQGVTTLEAFAEKGLRGKPKRGAAATFDRLQQQARIQYRAREEGEPLYERLPVQPKMGLCRLPAPDPADVYFDIEGDRFLEEGGREYLLGYAFREGDGPLEYRALWGLDHGDERRAFETLVDFLMARWKKHPGMHIYHFAPYEPAAMKRLMGRHASREDDIDRLLRSERFVDLYDVVRHGVRASVESYSIKELERFTGYERETDLREAVKGLRAVSLALALDATEELTGEIRGTIESYNRDDCLSTEALQAWLERVRQEAIDAGEIVERPEETTGDASERIEERRKEVQEIYDRLVDGLPEDPADRDDEQSGRWLLAQLLDYFRREDKGSWWEFFRMDELSDEDLLDERTAISGLTFVEEVKGGRCPVHRYRFPAQETKLRPGDSLTEPRGGKIGTVAGLAGAARTVDIKKAGAAADRHPSSVFVYKHFRKEGLERSLWAIADWASRNGIDAPGPFRAARDLLLRLPPRRRVAGDRGGGAGPRPGAAANDGNPGDSRQSHEDEHGAAQGPPRGAGDNAAPAGPLHVAGDAPSSGDVPDNVVDIASRRRIRGRPDRTGDASSAELRTLTGPGPSDRAPGSGSGDASGIGGVRSMTDAPPDDPGVVPDGRRTSSDGFSGTRNGGGATHGRRQRGGDPKAGTGENGRRRSPQAPSVDPDTGSGTGDPGAPLRHPGENVVDAARRLALELDQGVLAVQGPPGSGKTFTGARIILSLLAEGRSVGVTAVSHKVIKNLLGKTLEAAHEEGATIRCMHKDGKDADEGDDPPAGLAIATSNEQALRAIGPNTAVGGTAWLWSRDDAAGTLDTLIVDEAGQMSLAQVLAVSRAARNLILLGDPQQLQQPQQGTHPEGADAAALLHILGGAKTIAEDRGLFLDETWRLAPPIAAFTSELYYEGRLLAHAGLDRQEILGNSPFAGSGLFVVPVAHEGNQSSSPEEVDAIDTIVDGLLGSGLEWCDRDGVVRPLEQSDILIVSPYNAQVFALEERRPTMRIGTVDRFQGQEAPIVIYSMAVSAPEDAPRGMSFLYEPNRFNVATSRAKCAVILVASPRLFEPDCQSVAQMRMANGVARFVELGRPSP